MYFQERRGYWLLLDISVCKASPMVYCHFISLKTLSPLLFPIPKTIKQEEQCHHALSIKHSWEMESHALVFLQFRGRTPYPTLWAVVLNLCRKIA